MFKYFKKLASPYGHGDDTLDFWKAANLYILPFPTFPFHTGNLPTFSCPSKLGENFCRSFRSKLRKLSVEAKILGLL